MSEIPKLNSYDLKNKTAFSIFYKIFDNKEGYLICRLI